MSERFDTFGYTHTGLLDPFEAAAETATAEDGGGLDPRTAAAVLEETTKRARGQFDRRPPLLTLVAAVVVLVTYGSVWLSVRDQHPYVGPSGTALAVLYGTLAAWVVFVSVVLRRATSGVGGRVAAQRRLEGIAFGAIWITVYVFQGALHHAGASNAIVYGIYPATAPFVIVGAAAAAYEAARLNRGRVGLALAAVALGAGAAFAGPAAVWGVMGVGCSVLLLVAVAAQVRSRRG